MDAITVQYGRKYIANRNTNELSYITLLTLKTSVTDIKFCPINPPVSSAYFCSSLVQSETVSMVGTSTLMVDDDHMSSKG